MQGGICKAFIKAVIKRPEIVERLASRARSKTVHGRDEQNVIAVDVGSCLAIVHHSLSVSPYSDSAKARETAIGLRGIAVDAVRAPPLFVRRIPSAIDRDSNGRAALSAVGVPHHVRQSGSFER